MFTPIMAIILFIGLVPLLISTNGILEQAYNCKARNSMVRQPLLVHLHGIYTDTIENISIGIDWSSPFMKHSHEKEWTVKEALVQMNSNYYSKSFANRLSIEFNYYFNFGKRHNDYERAFTGSQAESGVLKRN